MARSLSLCAASHRHQPPAFEGEGRSLANAVVTSLRAARSELNDVSKPSLQAPGFVTDPLCRVP